MAEWFRRRTAPSEFGDWHLEGSARRDARRITACGREFLPDDDFDRGPHGPPPLTATCPECRAVYEQEAGPREL